MPNKSYFKVLCPEKNTKQNADDLPWTRGSIKNSIQWNTFSNFLLPRLSYTIGTAGSGSDTYGCTPETIESSFFFSSVLSLSNLSVKSSGAGDGWRSPWQRSRLSSWLSAGHAELLASFPGYKNTGRELVWNGGAYIHSVNQIGNIKNAEHCLTTAASVWCNTV